MYFPPLKQLSSYSFDKVTKEDNKRRKAVLNFSLLGFLFQETTHLLPSESHSFFPFVTHV